jgi:hypothetical protein
MGGDLTLRGAAKVCQSHGKMMPDLIAGRAAWQPAMLAQKLVQEE